MESEASCILFFFICPDRFHCEHVMVFTEALCYFKVNLLTSECIISFMIVINYITVGRWKETHKARVPGQLAG